MGQRILKNDFIDARMAQLTCRFEKSVEENVDTSMGFSHMSIALLYSASKY